MSKTTQLMLTVECTSEAETLLAAALDQSPVACVIITPQGWQPQLIAREESDASLPPLDPEVCARLVQLIQSKEAAALVANAPETAKTTGADGCHFDADDDLATIFDTARRFLGNDASIGTMPGATRHQAMTLAEAGTDYMGYPVSGDEHDEGISLMAWWAEIFETPVVAFTDGAVPTCERALLAGPPDFISIPLASTASPGRLAEITALIDQHGQLPTA